MPAVSDTSPLRYLVAVEQERLLPILFGKVIVPRGVHEELIHKGTPHQVSRFFQFAPDWYRVQESPGVRASLFHASLGRGEREAILLAKFLQADLLLIDDQLGRQAARSRNLVISGTLGVLESADQHGLLTDFPQSIERLKQSGFFLSDTLEREVLLRHRMRRGTK
jgi:predicted nucleic acid-binding protein